MKCKVIIVDAKLQEVRAGVVCSLEQMQELVAGYIERGHTLANGDEIYVNEEGLLRGPTEFFRIEGKMFALGGFIIGGVDDEGENTDVKTSLKDAAKMIEFRKLETV